MSLIKCPECGREFSDRAIACPNCGFPVSELHEATPENIAPESDSLANKIFLVAQTGVRTAVENYQNAYRPTKQIGPIQVDENHSVFRINGAIPVNGKKDGIGKSLLKGTLAISTLGMSLAAEKLVGGSKQKVGNKEWLNYSDLLNYELLEDDSLITSGGIGQALVGGAIFGGFGAIAGGITANRIQKKKIESLYIKVTTNSLSSPCCLIPLVTKPIKTNSKEYQQAFNLAHQILSTLDVITHRQ